MRLSTGKPSWRKMHVRSAAHSGCPPRHGPHRKETHPPPVLNQLLPVDLIQPRNPNVVPLGIHQPCPQLLILPSHGLKHHLRCRLCRVPVPQECLHPKPSVDWGDAATAIAVAICLLLLRQPQSRDLSRQSVDMILRLGFKSVLESYLLLAKLRRIELIPPTYRRDVPSRAFVRAH